MPPMPLVVATALGVPAFASNLWWLRRHRRAERLRQEYQQKLQQTTEACQQETARAREEAARAQESEARFFRIAEASPTPMWVRDATGHFVYLNRAWRDFTGASAEALNDPQWMRSCFVHPEDWDRFAEHLKRILEERAISEVTLRVRHRDGTYRTVLARSVPYYGPDDRLQGFVGAAQDITAWQEAQANLRDLLMAKHEFLATMSHELRTPLTSIIGYCELLETEVICPVPDAIKAELRRIDDAARHQLQLIEAVLQFGNLESATERAQFERVSTTDCLNSIMAVATPHVRKRGLSVLLDQTYAPPTVHTDPLKLRQVLLNLLTNAAKFTAQGTILLKVWADQSGVYFSVRDPGVGIAADDMQKIFEPFWQVRQSMVREVGGLGLGLTVAQRLTELLGGDLTVESEPGSGSTFTLRIPQ